MNKPVSPPSAAACTRLVGASLWDVPGSAVETLLALRAGTRARNERAGVRSALHLCGGWLVQWHEGPAGAVAAAWEAGLRNGAHRSARVLHCSAGPCVLSEAIQVSTLHAAETPAGVARRLYRLGREEDGGWTAEPAELWQALCTPCLLAGPEGLGYLARRQVLALTSEDNESVEMLRSLAQDHGVRVAYQRFAGADVRQGDVGAAYTDLPTGLSVVTRVHALSRRALAQGLARLSLGHLQSLVLMLGEPGRRTTELLDEVARLLAQLEVAPQVRLVVTAQDAGQEPLARLLALPRLDVAQVTCTSRVAQRAAVAALVGEHASRTSVAAGAADRRLATERPTG